MGKGVSEAAQKAADEAERPKTDSIRLSSGIVLKLKPVPPFLLRQATIKIERPVPPKIQIREGVEEENPDDPVYKQELKEYILRSAEAGSDLLFMVGTEVQSLPEGRVPPDSDEWLELVRFVGFAFDLDSKYARYLAWLKFYAIETEEDLSQLVVALGQSVGISEKEVADAVGSFRGGKVGRADNGVPPKDAGHGDHVPPNRRQRRTRGGGKGSR